MKASRGTVYKSKKVVLMLMGACMVLSIMPSFAAAPSDADERNADLVISSEKDIYRYVDDNGDIVFQDRPVSNHYNKEPFEPEAEIESVKVAEPAKEFKIIETKPWWPFYALLAAALSAWSAALFVIVQPIVKRWRSETAMDRCLRLANMPVFTKIQLHDGQRRNIEADRIVKTPAGLLVLGEAQFSGSITGTSKQATWHTTGNDGVSSIVNPIVPVNYASDIVRTLLGEIPVFGRVVYTGNATFDKGRPASVLKFTEFKKGLDHYAIENVESTQLDAAWRHLMRFPRLNNTPIKPLGVGWQGWLRRHWRETVSGGLAFTGLAALVVAFVMYR